MRQFALTFIIVIGVFGIAIAGPANDALKQAQALKDSGDLQGALKAVNDGLALEPDDFKLNRFAGDLNYELGNFQSAFAAYEIAVGKKKKDVDALYGAGMSAVKLGQFEKAIEYFERGLARKKKAELYHGLGTAQMELGSYSEADLNLRKAIDKDEENAWYHLALGEINYRNNVFSITVAEFKKAMAFDPAIEEIVSDIHYKLAQSHIKMRNLEEAIKEYRKDIELHPNDTTAWLELAHITQLANKHGDAAFCFVEYLKIMPNDGERWFTLGELYLKLRDHEKAAEAFEKAVSFKTREAEAFGYLARLYSDRKEYDKSWDAYTRYEAVFGLPDSVLYWFDKGKVAIKMGVKENVFFDSALTSFQKSIELDSVFSSAYEYAGLSMYYKRDYAAAVPFFRTKIRLDSASVNSYRNLAFCYLKTESYDKAGATFESALIVKPEDIQMRSMLGKIYTFNKNHQKAIKHFEILLNDDSADITDSIRCVIYPDLGYSYFELNKCDKSIPVLLKAEKCKPNETSILFNIAGSYEYCDKTRNARTYYEKVLAIDPGNKDAIKGKMRTTVQGQE
ncbi:MAG: tetratricopeptide repeat protein [candidate division Zixibacteria bacterium]